MIGSRVATALAALALLVAAGTAQAQTKLEMVVFGRPSLGAFFPPVIKAQRLDLAQGIDLTFVERPPDAYITQFNSGEFKLGGSAALLSIGIAQNRGVAVTYLFNLFDFWGAVVTANPAIQTLQDLAGKEIAAARGTTNFAMFDWIFRQNGLDSAKLKIVNTATPGLIGYALADRADAIQLWEPAYTLLLAKKPGIRTLDLSVDRHWKAAGGGDDGIPYLGVAAHQDWIKANTALVPKLLASYQAAATWTLANPAEAAGLIVAKNAPTEEREAVERLIRERTRLGIHVAPAASLRRGIETVFRAGQSTGYLSAAPGPTAIHDAP